MSGAKYFLMSSISDSNRKNAIECAKKLDLFFGPSKIFSGIFKACLLFSGHIINESARNQDFLKYAIRIDKEPIFK